MNTVDTALDLSAVRGLARPLDPVASVYLGLATSNPTLDAGEDLDLRWRSIGSRLASEGADPATIDAIGSVVAGTTSYPMELALFAASGQVRLGHHIPGGAPFDRARFGAPADLVPLLRWLQRHPPHVVVLTDRTGADMTTVPAAAAAGSTRTVVGPDDEIERNAPGGWSQPRYQRRAEDSWQHNAAAVAEAVTRALRESRAGLLLVAGDVRAVQLLREHLPPAVRRQVTVRDLPGGRGHDGSEAARQAAIVEAVDGYVADRDRAALERFTERGPGGTVEGVPATLAALAAGRVDTLFVADDTDDERTAWYAPHVLCAATRDEIARDAGAGQPAAGRLVDVAVRAALLTDAEVRVMHGPFQDRIGGVCRFVPTA